MKLVDQQTEQLEREADQEFGYRFGVDGLMTVAAACERLSVSQDTLNRMVLRSQIRKGKDQHTGRVSICRRSVETYISSLEV